MHVAVIGAGAFGGWTALSLLRSGARVTLVDAWGAGGPLSSSGGESRVFRHVYADRIYVDMAARALQLWREACRRWDLPLFRERGVIFMSSGSGLLDLAGIHMEQAGVELERLDEAVLSSRFPQMNAEGLNQAIYEPRAGYLAARMACHAVRDALVAEGGAYLQGRAMPGDVSNGELPCAWLEDGTRLAADRYVYACGPWLKELFPGIVGQHVTVTRQEVYFFRPPGRAQAMCRELPVWADLGERFWYGIPGADGTFKLADDTRGPEVDPTTQSRSPTEHGIEAARRYMEFRFPFMRGAPCVDSRVCQYSETPDTHFIADRHPQAANTWLLGGGSGHGFKHGPAMGEYMAAVVLGSQQPEPLFSLRRFVD